MNAVALWMIVITTLLVSDLAHAYLGPGAGLSTIGSVVAFIVAVLLLIVGFVWYPIKRLLKRKTSDPPPAETQNSASVNSKSSSPSDQS